jgi:hypothetical protein
MNKAIAIEVTQDKGANMRKIEKAMLDAIHNRKDWSSGNTSVRHYPSVFEGIRTHVRLHGNLIAIITDIEADTWQRNDIELFSCGWETVTTKSRLNALLAHTPFKIIQKNSQWFIQKNSQWQTKDLIPFHDEIKLPY